MAITASIENLPFDARIEAANSAVSPGSGTPIDSTAMSTNRIGRPTWLTSTIVASTCRAYDGPVDPAFGDPRARRRQPRPRRRAADCPRGHPDARIRPAGDEGD